MTIPQILAELKPFKPLSRPGLYLALKRLNIRPAGIRQIPAQYPDDTPARILSAYGLTADYPAPQGPRRVKTAPALLSVAALKSNRK